MGLPWWPPSVESACNAEPGFSPWVRKIPLKKEMSSPPPVFLCGHGQRSCGPKGLDPDWVTLVPLTPVYYIKYMTRTQLNIYMEETWAHYRGRGWNSCPLSFNCPGPPLFHLESSQTHTLDSCVHHIDIIQMLISVLPPFLENGESWKF